MHVHTMIVVCLYHTCSYSQGTGRIWLDNVNCHSSSTRLSDCSHLGWGVLRSCFHSEDIALQCSTTTITPPTTPPRFSEYIHSSILKFNFIRGGDRGMKGKGIGGRMGRIGEENRGRG